MLRPTLALGAVLLAAASTAAAVGNPLHGTFKTVITFAPSVQLKGTWQVDLLPTGRYTIERNGTVLIRGRDTETATKITFGHETGPAACTGSEATATYHWSLKAGLLRLTAVNETCLGRRVVLTANPLLKTG